MSSITIRNLSDGVKESARVVAACNGRSIEAEIRALLEKTYAPLSERAAYLRAMSGPEFVDHLIRTANGATLEIPERETFAVREVFGAD